MQMNANLNDDAAMKASCCGDGDGQKVKSRERDLSWLKQAVSKGTYRVDADKAARAIVSRIMKKGHGKTREPV